jgi:sulfur carrier protein ThiS
MNYDKYIGLPYLDNGRTKTGVDCWGLARLVYQGEFDIDLPSYTQEYIGGTDPHIVEAVNLYKDNWQELATPNIGDLCLFNIFGEPMHVGVFIGENKFLHSRRGSDSVIESLNNTKWKNRFVGFYAYAPQAQIQAIGAPHPLKLSVYRDWTVAGTTVQDFVEFIRSKYTVSTELVSKIVVMIDGIVVPKSEWSTTTVKKDQQISYKSVAEGNSTRRLIIAIAAIYIIANGGGAVVGEMLGAEAGSATAKFVGSVAIQMGSMILQNVIAPIRPPKTNDPGSALGLNLLSGTANQASPYAAIPVVLGKVRFTGMLGATPYIESLTETNILNLAVVWGFGPLSITDLSIGAKPIDDFYFGEPASVPRPIIINGFARDYELNATGGIGGTFNNQYGRDVQQKQVNLELTNNASNITGGAENTATNITINGTLTLGTAATIIQGTSISFTSSTGTGGAPLANKIYYVMTAVTSSTTVRITDSYAKAIAGTGEVFVAGSITGTNTVRIGGNGTTRRWQQVDLTQDADAVDIVLSFPEGMRKINTKNGDISQTSCGIEIQMRQYSALAWPEEDSSSSLNVYSFKPGDASAFQLFTMVPPGDAETGANLYRYTTFCVSPSGGIQRFDGAITDTFGANASDSIQALFAKTAYSSLLGTSATKSYQPQIPTGYLPIYTIYQDRNGTVTEITPHPIATYSGKSGLTYSLIEIQEGSMGMDSTPTTSPIKTIKITSGRVYGDASGADLTAGEVEIWSTDNLFTAANETLLAHATGPSSWGTFLTRYAVWSTVGYTVPAATAANPDAYGGTWNFTAPGVYFPYSGYYTVEAAADDQGEILIGGVRAVQIPKDTTKNAQSIKGLIKLKAGTHDIVLSGVDNQAAHKGIAARITYIANNGVNVQASANTILTFGEGAWFTKRKDAFNWVHSVENITRAKYQVRVRRTNSDETEDETDQKKFHKAILTNVTAYDSLKLPMENPPGCFLAKTGIRVQSSSKINGQIDGVNAMVQTITWDYDRTAGTWTNLRETNNPASLFAYVLMHPANAFRVTSDKIDLVSLTAWHNYCNPVPQDVSSANLITGRYYTIKTAGTTNWMAIGAKSNNVGEGFYATSTWTGGGVATYHPKFAYNAVLSSTQSVMDTLRDICAAGKASPTYIDGKWGVVIDTERSHTVQHFTEHNSWGFESTKVLPVLPHAFRINLNDETLAYQANEIIVYNYGYGPTTANGKIGATLFEQINLPGVTNPDQAVRLARWHFAQIKLRPETYTVNVDFEHLVCTRGDKVKITHSVPQWGIGSGRLGPGVDDVVTGTTLTLTEPVALTANTQYTILIRTNNITTTAGSGSVTRNFTYTGTTGYTSTITVPNIAAGDGVKTDNLFMIGLTTNSVQECIVTAVEPSNNYSARLTLVDYSPEIYTQDLSGLLTYNPNISTRNVVLVQNSITSAPIITSITSNSTQSNQIAAGTYQNKATVAFTNPNDLQAVAVRVQFDIIEGSVAGWDSTPGTLYDTDKSNSSFDFINLLSNKKYKVRARYTNADRTICGPWSLDFAFTNDGKNRNFQTPPAIALDLENTYIVADPTIVTTSKEIAGYAYRLYKDSGTTDLWDTTPIIPEVINNGQGRLNLLDVPVTLTEHRISDTGVTYRVACRVVDKLGNYSDTSSYGTTVAGGITYNYIKIKTIV